MRNIEQEKVICTDGTVLYLSPRTDAIRVLVPDTEPLVEAGTNRRFYPCKII